MNRALRFTACIALFAAAVLTSCSSSHPQSTTGTPNKNIKPNDAYYNIGGSPQGASIPRQTYDRSPN